MSERGGMEGRQIEEEEEEEVGKSRIGSPGSNEMSSRAPKVREMDGELSLASLAISPLDPP